MPCQRISRSPARPTRLKTSSCPSTRPSSSMPQPPSSWSGQPTCCATALASRLWARGRRRPGDSPAHVEANQTHFCPPRAVALLREPAALLGKVVGERVRDRFDYIFLDTAPNLTLPIVAAYNATDYLLLSAILEPLAMESIRRFLQSPFWNDKTLCRSRGKSPKYC